LLPLLGQQGQFQFLIELQIPDFLKDSQVD